jgi:hypothetical protein
MTDHGAKLVGRAVRCPPNAGIDMTRRARSDAPYPDFFTAQNENISRNVTGTRPKGSRLRGRDGRAQVRALKLGDTSPTSDFRPPHSDFRPLPSAFPFPKGRTTNNVEGDLTSSAARIADGFYFTGKSTLNL